MTGSPSSTAQSRMEAKLTAALHPTLLEVINESHHHAGHGGDNGSGESHFRVKIVSAAFAGQSRVAMHRIVNELLGDELKGNVHALAIEAKAP